MLYRYYIGSNNRTKKLEDKKALRIISKQYEGLTAFKGLGYWQGKAEKSLIVEVEAEDKNKVIELARILAKELKQEAIGLAEIGKLNFISV
jgi:hypothetical protein